MIRETWLETDLQQPVSVDTLPGVVFSQDNLGNRIGVSVTDGGEDVTLEGTVRGFVIRSDGATVIVEGQKSGNRAWIDLPEAAYAKIGKLEILIRLINGDTKTTIGGCRVYVYRTSTETYVDPGEVMPSIEALLEMIEELEQQIFDYDNLANRPQIAGHTLTGNLTLDTLGIQPAGDYATEEDITAIEQNYVAKDGDKVLSDNNYTDNEKEKLNQIAANAEVNTIVSIKMAGNTLPIVYRTVDIPEFIGANASVDGVPGLVPTPESGEQRMFLRGDGVWANVQSMTGASSYSDGANGLVPAPITNEHLKFLRGDGTWSFPADMLGATSATDGESGFVPMPSAGDEGKFLRGDGNWAVPTPNDMTGATSSADGVHGLVPAPLMGDETKYLRGDGVWATPSGGSGGGATYHLSQDQQDGHILTLTGTDGVSDTVTVPDNDTTYSAATQSTDGLMSATDKTRLDGILELVYPVGSIYMSVNSTDPGTLFGGTWQRIQDTFLLAAGTTYAAGATGGEAEHQLTADELPKQSGIINFRSRAGNDLVTYTNGVFSNSMETNTSTLTSVANGSSSAKYQQIKYASGNNQPHNNMPPYLAVYVWQRTA